ncbi:MAG: hexitol phosphatase HxpB [bacterium]|nr:hexitol phosphatase HxpB [bacterium]
MTHSYEAHIFDMDGLLIDSEPLWRIAEIKVLNQLGVGLTDEMCKQTMGLRLDEMVAYWAERFPWSGPSEEEVGSQILAEVMELVSSEGQPMSGARRLLNHLKESGETIALASSSPSVLIQAVLKKLEFEEYFSEVCSAEYEKFGKPHPGVYLKTASNLKANPKHCLAYEDSINGARSALAAGMSVVAIPCEGEFELESEALQIFGSLSEYFTEQCR